MYKWYVSLSSAYLVSLGCKLKVGSFDDCINRASFLAKTTVDAFCHVDIIPVYSFKPSLHLHYEMYITRETRWCLEESIWLMNGSLLSGDLVVLRLPSSLSSASMVIA